MTNRVKDTKTGVNLMKRLEIGDLRLEIEDLRFSFP
jgi:hypothetical protein